MADNYFFYLVMPDKRPGFGIAQDLKSRNQQYCSHNGKTEQTFNPNGSIKNIAGIFNKEKNVLGMMPHPERMIDQSLSGEDGSLFFKNLINNIK